VVGGTWAVLAVVLSITTFGEPLQLGQWVLDLSPFAHLPEAARGRVHGHAGGLAGGRGRGARRRRAGRLPPPRPGLERLTGRLHAGDELVDPVVVGAERVLAQDGPLGLVVELEVDPVDGVVAAALLGLADELAPEAGPGWSGGGSWVARSMARSSQTRSTEPLRSSR
jgi:hypothetical protein